MRHVLLLLFALIPAYSRAQAPPASYRDDLLDRLAGSWNAVGIVHGNQSRQRFSGEWVLQHQFFRLSQTSAEKSAATGTPYEGVFYIGWDDTQRHYIAHLMNVFGGRDSEILGYGQRNGNEIQFVFKSVEGSVVERFRWEPKTKAWRVLSTLSTPEAKPFLELTMTRSR